MRPAMLVLVFAVAAPLWANAAPPPDNYEVRSPNGEWVLRCHRRDAVQRVFKLGQNEAAWEFSVTDPWDQNYFVSNDGATVAQIGPWWVKANETASVAVRIRNRTGVLGEFDHDTLCPRIDKTQGSPGWLWRSEQSANFMIIKAQDGTLSRISLETGKLVGQETFEIEQERARGHCSVAAAVSAAAASGFALLALLCAVTLLRRARHQA